MYLIFVSSTTLLITGFGIGTYLRNLDWKDEKTLWEDAIAKAPGMARPFQNMAWGYYERAGKYAQALNFYEKALNLKDTNPTYARLLSLTNMASIYYRQQEYEKAIELCQTALDFYPNYVSTRKVLTLALLKAAKWEEACKSAELLHSKHNTNAEFMFMLSFSLIKVKKYKEALSYLRKLVRTDPNDKKILYNIGVTLSLMEKYQRAEWFLKSTLHLSPDDIFISFYLIENSIKAGDHAGVERYLDQLFRTHSIKEITIHTKSVPAGALKIAFSPNRLAPLIADHIEDKTTEIEALAKLKSNERRLSKATGLR